MDSLRKLTSQWDRAVAIGATLLGAVLLTVGYFGVSGEALVPLQMPYIVSGGLGGIFLLGLGGGLWLSADLRDEWRKLDRIEVLLETRVGELGLARTPEGTPAIVPLESDSSGEPPRRKATATAPAHAGTNGA